jgi:flagellar hook-associated protein 2
MSVITSTGLGSGLDINSMISKLVAAEKAPKASRLDRQEAELQAKISGFGTIKGTLSDFRSSLDPLRNASTFQQLEASTSDATIVSASTKSNADPGDYSLDVKQLAQMHALATKAFNSASDRIGTGTLTIRFGTTTYDGLTDSYTAFSQNADIGTLSLTLDTSNNSLSGIRDAINDAKAGVKASIINDGTGYRLILNASNSGAKNSLEITVTDDDRIDTDGSGLSALAFNASSTQMTQTQRGQDAIVKINGLEITSASNTVSDALKGVTLALGQAQPGKPVNLSIKPDNDEITKSIEAFVEKFNEVTDTIKKLSSFDPQAKKGGALMGEASIRGAVARM